MPFAVYDTKIGPMYVGNTEIVKAYLGDTLVYQKGESAPPNYFWAEAISAGTFTLNIPASVTTTRVTSVSYSLDGGETWVTTQNTDDSAVAITTPEISAGDKVLWKGIATSYASGFGTGAWSTFTGTANHNVGGNILSLFKGDNFASGLQAYQGSYALLGFFRGNKKVINAKDLILPVKNSSDRCHQFTFCQCSNLKTAPEILMERANGYYSHYGMFESCTALEEAPVLHITVTGIGTMQRMFYGCTSLLTPPPEISAVTLTSSVCYSMFQGCSNLQTAPVIRATTLGSQSCRAMFRGCSSLTTAPELKALTLTANCYNQMFYGCTNLNYIKMMATNISATNCLSNWVYNVNSEGTFVKNAAAEWTLSVGASGIPTNFTVTTASS